MLFRYSSHCQNSRQLHFCSKSKCSLESQVACLLEAEGERRSILLMVAESVEALSQHACALYIAKPHDFKGLWLACN